MLVIRDTRESGEMLEAAVAAGVAAAGGEALLGGVLPTPGAPLLIGRYGLDLGVVISASHNPYRDNGIKFFGGDGFKLSDETELEIEEALDEPPAEHAPQSAPSAASTARSRTTCAACTSASRGLDLQRPHASCSTAPTAPPTAPRPRSSAASAPRSTCSPPSPTAATSTTAAARPTSSGSPTR